MNSLDFLKELNEIDDTLLMEAELPLKKKTRVQRIGMKTAFIVLAVFLFSLTVAAVTISIRIFTSDDTVPNYENYHTGFFKLESKVTTIEYELSPQQVAIPLQWESALTSAWKEFGYDYEYFTGIDLKDEVGKRINFGGIAQLAQLLKIPLVISEELELVTQGAYVTLVVTDPSRAAEQFRTEGRVCPDGIILYLPFLRNTQTGLNPEIIDFCGLSIFIPLTDSFADQYASHILLSSAYKQELTEERFTSGNGIEVVLLQNTSQGEEMLSAYAAWEQGGIGYLVEMKTAWGAEASPGDLLMPYLENLEGSY